MSESDFNRALELAATETEEVAALYARATHQDRDFSTRVADILRGRAASIRLLKVPDLPPWWLVP
jgi:hypothetical protein